MIPVREATWALMRAHGMTTVFGNPGSTELSFFLGWPADFRYVLGLQESVVVGMADGYAQASGNAAFVNLHSAVGVGHAMGAIFMEYDDDRSGDFRPLRFLKPGRIVVLGLVTTKFGQLETKETLKRRILEAAGFAPLEQLALSPQCGFSSTVHGNNIAVEDQKRKLQLVVEVANEVWG